MYYSFIDTNENQYKLFSNRNIFILNNTSSSGEVVVIF